MSEANNSFLLKIVPVVLLAGFSSRMGRLKQHLEFNGKTFLNHVLDKLVKLEKCLCKPFIFVGQVDDYKSKQIIESYDNLWLVNIRPEDGMISSILVALDYISNNLANSSILLWPIDFALVDVKTLSLVVETFIKSLGRKFVVPSYNFKRGHPVIIPAWAINELYNAPKNLGARWLFNKYEKEIEYVTVDDSLCVKNINTPNEYNEVLNFIKLNKP